MNGVQQIIGVEEDLEGWIALDSLIAGDDLLTLIQQAQLSGVDLFKIVDLKPYIPEKFEGRILNGLAQAN